LWIDATKAWRAGNIKSEYVRLESGGLEVERSGNMKVIYPTAGGSV
jgi:hypothetical protein